MSKFYILLTFSLICNLSFTQNGNIPNGGFENWTTANLYDDLTIWTTSNADSWQGVAAVTQSTDSYSANYSCEISSQTIGSAPDTVFGYVIHGNVGPSGPEGGIPYTDNFDEVRFQYKCDIPAGDTLYILTIRYMWGTQVDFNFAPAAYGTANTWTEASIPIPSNPQDQLFIGFVMGDPFSGPKPTPGAWARIDDVKMYNASTQVSNVFDPGFELWESVSTEIPDNWGTLNEALAGANLENAIKTIDANSGNYAIELTTFQHPDSGDTIPGMLSLAPINIYSSNPFSAIPYNATPTTFSGTYKYTGANGDQGGVQIEFFQAGLSVGTHFETFTDASTYTTFSSPLTITGTPDSVLFLSYSGDNPGSVLKLDDLAFSGGDVSIEEFKKMSISLYPNPAKDIIMVKAEGTYNVKVLDLAGNVVLTRENMNGAEQMNVSELSRGAYIVQIDGIGAVQSLRFIKE